MKKSFLSLWALSALLLPVSANAQIQGFIPGSADPVWTCSLSARAVYVDQNWNDIQYSVRYRMNSDFGVATVLSTEISNGLVAATQEYDVTITPTPLEGRLVSKQGVTTFHYNYNTQDGAPRQIRVQSLLGEESCGSVVVEVASAPNQIQPISAVIKNQEPAIGAGGIAAPQLNLPVSDPDDATAEPIVNEGNDNNGMVVRDNISPEFQPPVAANDNSGAGAEPVADPVVAGAVSGEGSTAVSDAGTAGSEVDTSSESVITPDRESSRPIGETVPNTPSAGVVMMPTNNTMNFLLYALIGSVGVLTAVVIYLLMKRR